jgi:hypothetical protein
MSSSSRLFRKYKRGELLIESGTDVGAGIVAALAAGYTQVISIEIDKNTAEWWNSRMLPEVPEVSVIAGDSPTVIRALLCADIPWQTATFWLDAHAVGKGSALPRELDVLLAREDFRGYLLMDDMRLIRSGQEWAKGMKEDDIVSRLGGWHMTYEASPHDPKDILVAWRHG